MIHSIHQADSLLKPIKYSAYVIVLLKEMTSQFLYTERPVDSDVGFTTRVSCGTVQVA